MSSIIVLKEWFRWVEANDVYLRNTPQETPPDIVIHNHHAATWHAERSEEFWEKTEMTRLFFASLRNANTWKSNMHPTHTISPGPVRKKLGQTTLGRYQTIVRIH